MLGIIASILKDICKRLGEIKEIEEQRMECQKLELALKKDMVSEKDIADFLEIDIEKINKEKYFI